MTSVRRYELNEEKGEVALVDVHVVGVEEGKAEQSLPVALEGKGGLKATEGGGINSKEHVAGVSQETSLKTGETEGRST